MMIFRTGSINAPLSANIWTTHFKIVNVDLKIDLDIVQKVCLKVGR